MADFRSNTDFELKSVVIYPLNGGTGQTITKLVNRVTYVESILSPSVAATLEDVDSVGILQKLPIQGTEVVEISVITSQSEEPFDYRFRVWKVANRYAKQQQQVYTIGLVSEEMLNNEAIRITKPVKGKTDEIAASLLTESLQTGKTLFSEPVLREVKYMAVRQRPFDLITRLGSKSLSTKAGGSAGSSSGGSNTEGNQEEAKQASGSAGFLFWENRRGYNLFSVDSMCSEKEGKLRAKEYDVETWGPYVEKVGNQEDGSDDRFTIASSDFVSDLDIMSSLRMGKYSSRVIFYNISTGEYSEYVYKIRDSYDKMAHLGGQVDIPEFSGVVKLDQTPTRNISSIIDHETWQNDPEPGSPEQQDQGTGETKSSPYADFNKDFLVQSIARYESLRNQSCVLVVPGNAQICAGDQIDIRLKNKVPGEEAKSEEWDNESSGVFLIEEVTHQYDRVTGTNGQFYTTLRLMRDSYGMKDKASAHSSK